MIAAEAKTDEQLEQLDAQIGMIDDPERMALEALQEHQEVMGMTFEDPDAPVAPTPGHGPDEEFR